MRPIRLAICFVAMMSLPAVARADDAEDRAVLARVLTLVAPLVHAAAASPDPRAPEYGPALHAHVRWWQAIANRHAELGRTHLTFTPEFGPDGYLHCEPFTQRPAADLRDLNHWMMRHLRDVITPPPSSYDFGK